MACQRRIDVQNFLKHQSKQAQPMEQVKCPALHGDKKKVQPVRKDLVNTITNKGFDETPLWMDTDDLRPSPDLDT